MADLIALVAALRHQVRYLAAWRRVTDDIVDRDVFARHTITRDPVGPRAITLLTRRPGPAWNPDHHEEVGRFEYRICDRCRLPVVHKIRVYERWQRRRYANWMLDRSRRFAPTYRWITSCQRIDSRGFWQGVKARLPGVYREGRSCRHIHASQRHPARQDRRSLASPHAVRPTAARRS